MSSKVIKLRIKNIFGLILSMFFLIFIINLSFAYSDSGSLNVMLLSQNPDPVSPGNYVYLNLKISNSGSENIQDVKVSLVEDKYFKIAPGYLKEKDLGLIPAYSNIENSASFAVSKFKVYVSDETPIGLDTIRFKINIGGEIYYYKFNILVQEKNPNLELISKNFNKTTSPGSSSKFELVLKNNNNISLKNVVVSLDLDNLQNDVITVKNTNVIKVPLLKPGEIKNLNYTLFVNPDVESKSYAIPILVYFQDALGNNYTNKFLGSINVYSKPDLAINLDSRDILTKGIAKYNIAIANPGRSVIKGVQINVLNTNDYTVIDDGYSYIGDLNPDDYQTMQTKLNIVTDNDSFNLKLRVSYFDAYNHKITKIVEIPVHLTKKDKSYENSSITNIVLFIVLLLLLIIILVQYFKCRNCKNVKNKN